jgi:HK97 gp10 family phage protein
MALQSTGKIVGLREARESLKLLSKTVQRNVGQRALMAGAEVLASRVRERLPVSDDPHNKTPGSLRANTKAAKGKSNRGRPTAVMLVDDVAAVPFELGTGRQQARPTVRPTVDANRGAAAEAIGPAMVREVDAAAQRAAKKG